MPRPTKGPRLYLIKPRGRPGFWYVRDGAHQQGTGCAEGDIAGAEAELARYIRQKRKPGGSSDPAKVSIAAVLSLYAQDIAPEVKRPDVLTYTVETLERWWGDKVVSDVKGSSCRAYATWRAGQRWAKAKASKREVGVGTVRRELETLRAAINHYHAEHTLDAVPVVTLPAKPPPRERWLTRSEVARLLWATRRHKDSRHLARFILIGVYTGTRHSAILNLGWMPNTAGGWVDVERGVLHRRAQATGETKKRQPPAALPDRILAHLRRWRSKDDRRIRTVVHFEGMPIAKERRAWRSACKAAGLGDEVVPHIMRHTSITWAMQNGADMWEASGFFGVSIEVLQAVYGHHHADFQKEMRKVF